MSGVGWYFNKIFPHTSVFEDLTYRIIETGLLVPWKQWTYAQMRRDYLQVSRKQWTYAPNRRDYLQVSRKQCMYALMRRDYLQVSSKQ